MGEVAKVQDPQALRDFRLALLKFAEKVTSALGEADAEVQRVTMWLENEQTTFWSNELRKRQEWVIRCKEALRFKQVFKSTTGGKNSTVDEEKALSLALKRHAEAEQKCLNVKKWIRQLHREAHLYRGSVQRLATTVATDVPQAGAKMLRMVAALEQYLALKAPSLGPAILGSGDGMSLGDGAERTGYAKLRQSTPPAPVKDKAPASDSPVGWTAGELAPGDAEVVANLTLNHQPPDAASTLIVAPGVESARRIYLERSAPAFPGDNGWFIGSTEPGPMADFYSLRVNQLLIERPEFEPLMALPIGTLVVIDSAGIAAVLNENDEEVWKAAVSSGN